MAGEHKFWNTAHLVRELVPFLDLSSILNFASAHAITLALVFQNSAWRRSFWRNLLSRTTMREEELFFHRKQQQVLERNPARQKDKLTEEELLVIFGGLHD